MRLLYTQLMTVSDVLYLLWNGVYMEKRERKARDTLLWHWFLGCIILLVFFLFHSSQNKTCPFILVHLKLEVVFVRINYKIMRYTNIDLIGYDTIRYDTMM